MRLDGLEPTFGACNPRRLSSTNTPASTSGGRSSIVDQDEGRSSKTHVMVSGFEPRKSSSSPLEREEYRPAAPLVRRYSISGTSVSPHSSDVSKQALATKVQRFKDEVKLAKEDYLELRQEVSDLQEYSNAKLDRVARYLGVLAKKTHQVALETEARKSPLINEKKRLFNDLLTAKGNVKVFCRTRPLFEEESPSIVDFPDDCTIRVSTGDDSISNPKKDFELDRVYGPHVGQAELFSDAQPLVQSTLDGYNVSIFAYGQTNSGKTLTMFESFSEFASEASDDAFWTHSEFLMA
ncbi:hypothetical protein LWI29_036423 [Acer saccharum]|uniref:Kinesin motor domain-containing protein n=1 Tax=Acer saccharum TaxID=4024 RepID=A0AA39TP09_ACESA|nr:hypothetical protein LWI29_036423 [Acer saccharum]